MLLIYLISSTDLLNSIKIYYRATLKELTIKIEKIAEQFCYNYLNLDDKGRYYYFNVDYRFEDNKSSVPASNKFVDRPFDTAGLERYLLPRSRRNYGHKIFVLYRLTTFSSVFWLDGRSEDRLRQSLAGCVSRIPEGQIPNRSKNHALNNEDDLNLVVMEVLEWLARPDNTDWLLVFDNVDQDHEQGRSTVKDDLIRFNIYNKLKSLYKLAIMVVDFQCPIRGAYSRLGGFREIKAD
ncbi:hypothetical protein B0T21DRAFT_352573 [Apiosordaria backusii]|uniref:Uncharacterized protein n=1 Tax=Apiosordaria backusii TaxID=314023 RepID=A0AA40DR38_9PEZI|nr:hypothetical protein B0T21DRAFT_352573 [Apiosordaria backusii]